MSQIMIRGKCITYIDEYKRKVWPTLFSPNIAVGHFVRSADGTTLKIQNIIHTMTYEKPIDPYFDAPDMMAKLEIEIG